MAVPGLPLESPVPVGVGTTPHDDLHTNANDALNYLGDTAQAAATVFAAPPGSTGAGDFRLLTPAFLHGVLNAPYDQAIDILVTSGASPLRVTSDGLNGNNTYRSYNGSGTATNNCMNLILTRAQGSAASPAVVVANDRIGRQLWQGWDGAAFVSGLQELVEAVATIASGIVPMTYKMSMILSGSSTLREVFSVLQSEIVFNQDSQDIDFRVESDGNANALFVDAGNNRVGILTNTPNSALEVVGTAQVDVLRIDQNTVVGAVVPTDTFTINLNGTVYRVPCLI